MQEIERTECSLSFVPNVIRPNCLRRTGDAASKASASSPRTDFKAVDVPMMAIGRGHLAITEFPYSSDGGGELPRVFILTADPALGAEISDALSDPKRSVEVCASVEVFFSSYPPRGESCLVIDARLGLGLLSRVVKAGNRAPPAIAIIGRGDVRAAVRAIAAGALDCIEKPLETGLLTAGVRRALVRSHELLTRLSFRKAIVDRLATLTPRERQIMELVLAGHPNKNIAADLCVSQRTVESHRASIMKKTGTRSLPALVRLALSAAVETDGTFGPIDLPSEMHEESFAAGAPLTATDVRRTARYYPNLPRAPALDRLGAAAQTVG